MLIKYNDYNYSLSLFLKRYTSTSAYVWWCVTLEFQCSVVGILIYTLLLKYTSQNTVFPNTFLIFFRPFQLLSEYDACFVFRFGKRYEAPRVIS